MNPLYNLAILEKEKPQDEEQLRLNLLYILKDILPVEEAQ